MGIENIDHSKTKIRSPQIDGGGARFHRTMKQEFYDIVFRKRIYNSVEELYKLMLICESINNNTQRTHSGKHCYGKTFLQTFLDSKYIALEKILTV